MSPKVFRVVIGILMVLGLVGVMTYLKLAFEGGDAKTAIRLVNESPIGGSLLGERLSEVIPEERRLCSADFINRFYGHMEVSCTDVKNPNLVFRWQVNVTDGMVRPSNEAARELGQGVADDAKGK